MGVTPRQRIVTYWTWGMYWRLCWRSVRHVGESQAVPS